MEKGVFLAHKKNGDSYYRSSITYRNKHISLGSFTLSSDAHNAYLVASQLLFEGLYNISDYAKHAHPLAFDKWVSLLNFRDHGYYFKTPIYLSKYYFSYFLDEETELLFDVDDLFYYANHTILRRQGYYFTNDFGMQINIYTRYGIRNFSVPGKDYLFKDGNPNNLRYHNVVVVNPYYGVEQKDASPKAIYVSKIHLNGYYIVGKYDSIEKAAVAYNKAADFLVQKGIVQKDFPKNYVDTLTTEQYKILYQQIKISKKLLSLEMTSFH